MADMGKVEVEKMPINMRILKICRFYQMLDPIKVHCLNLNVYRVSYIVFLAFNLCVLLLGYVGISMNKDDTLNAIEMFLVMFKYIHISLCLVKFCVFLYKVNTVLDLFDISRLDFLTSKQCQKNINMLYDWQDCVIKVSNYIILTALVTNIYYIMMPFILNASDDTVNRRKQNVLNLRFPVSIHTYNQYYVMFYVIELIVLSLSSSTMIFIDMLIMYFCWVIIILYQILTKSFADVGYANKPQSEHYEDFISIVSDQIQLYLKLKSLYDIIRPIILMYAGLSLCIIIFLTYAFIVVCSSLGTYTAFEVLNIGSSIVFYYFEIFIFYYLLDHLNTNRDSVNFGMYCSNWTMMDLKFKKLLLLAMRMNDANQMVLKASPKNIINLQLFANVMKICYNVTSVMVKTMNNKQK